MVEKKREKEEMGRAVKQEGGRKDGENKQEMGAGWFFPAAVSMALSLLLQGSAVWLTAGLCPRSSQRDVGDHCSFLLVGLSALLKSQCLPR